MNYLDIANAEKKLSAKNAAVYHKGARIDVYEKGGGFSVEVGKGAYSKTADKVFKTADEAKKEGIRLIDSGAVD